MAHITVISGFIITQCWKIPIVKFNFKCIDSCSIKDKICVWNVWYIQWLIYSLLVFNATFIIFGYFMATSYIMVKKAGAPGENYWHSAGKLSNIDLESDQASNSEISNEAIICTYERSFFLTWSSFRLIDSFVFYLSNWI